MHGNFQQMHGNFQHMHGNFQQMHGNFQQMHGNFPRSRWPGWNMLQDDWGGVNMSKYMHWYASMVVPIVEIPNQSEGGSGTKRRGCSPERGGVHPPVYQETRRLIEQLIWLGVYIITTYMHILCTWSKRTAVMHACNDLAFAREVQTNLDSSVKHCTKCVQ